MFCAVRSLGGLNAQTPQSLNMQGFSARRNPPFGGNGPRPFAALPTSRDGRSAEVGREPTPPPSLETG